MRHKNTRKNRVQFILLVSIAPFLFIFLLMTIYFFTARDTSKSYSLTQTWNEYYSLEDWNLSSHAVVDIDTDGQKDIVTFTNCAFLSSVPKENIPIDRKCEEPTMSILAFPQDSIKVGQKLFSQKPFHYQWLKKSYLVKTQNNVWKFYDMNGLFLKTFELGNDHLFTEVIPTILDKIDTLTYQISHLGIAFILPILL